MLQSCSNSGSAAVGTFFIFLRGTKGKLPGGAERRQSGRCVTPNQPLIQLLFHQGRPHFRMFDTCRHGVKIGDTTRTYLPYHRGRMAGKPGSGFLFFSSVFGLFSCRALNPLLNVVTSNCGILWRQFVSPERLRYFLHMQQEFFQTRQIPSVGLSLRWCKKRFGILSDVIQSFTRKQWLIDTQPFYVLTNRRTGDSPLTKT